MRQRLNERKGSLEILWICFNVSLIVFGNETATNKKMKIYCLCYEVAFRNKTRELCAGKTITNLNVSPDNLEKVNIKQE